MTVETDGIRTATPADLPQVERIVAGAYQPWVSVIGSRPGPMDANYPHLVHSGSVHLTGAPEPIGLIVLTPEPDTMLVENVAVQPDRQGEGIGLRLMAFAETTARALGLSTIRLYTHELMTVNIALYQRLGFEITDREQVAAGELIHLRKALADH